MRESEDIIHLVPSQPLDLEYSSPKAHKQFALSTPGVGALHASKPSGSLAVLLGYIVWQVLLYSIGLVVPSGFTDSYATLALGEQGMLHDFDVEMVSYGRPVQAILVNLGSNVVHTIGDLRWQYLVAVLGLATLALLLYRTLRLAGIRQSYALIIPLIICTLPAYEVWIFWGTGPFFSWAAALAGAALPVAEQAIQHRASWRGWALGTLSMMLLLLSVLIYQPAMLVFLVFAAIPLLCRPASLKRVFSRFVLYSSMVILVIGVDALAAKTLPILLYGTTGFSEPRTQLAGNIAGKANWFVHEPLLDALNLWNLLPSVVVAWLVAAFSLVGLVLFLHGAFWVRLVRLALALLLVPLSYLPNLIVAEDWASYRTQAALSSLVVLYVTLALLGFFQTLRLRRRHIRIPQGALATTLLILVLALGSGMAMSNVTQNIVLPQAEELSFLASQLNQPALTTARSIYVIPCSWSDSIAPVARYDEFGLPSCSHWWSAGPMVWLLLRQLHPAESHLPIIVTDSGTIKPPPASLVIDLRLIRQQRMTEPAYR